MSSIRQTILRSFLGLLMGATALQPLHAQLDPRLQAAPTDFTDLFQQTSSLKAKPEIVTIFDFSRSMASLMFHPLYRNDDAQDLDDYRFMKFQVTTQENAGGTASNNTYTITANPKDGCTAAATSFQVTVASNGVATLVQGSNNAACTTATGGSTAPSAITISVFANSSNNAKATLTYSPGSTLNAATSNNTPYTLTANAQNGAQGVSPTVYPGQYTITHADKTQTTKPIIEVYKAGVLQGNGPFAAGTVLNLVAYLWHPVVEGDTGAYNQCTWSGTGISGAVSTIATGTAGLYKTTANWTVPTFTYVAPTTPANNTQLQKIHVSPAGPYTAGQTLTLTDYFITQGTSTGPIKFTPSGTNLCGTGPGSMLGAGTPYTTGNTTTGPGTSLTWKIPAYCGTTTGATAAIVTVTLDASTSIGLPLSAPYPAYPGVLTATTNAAGDANSALRKPDGSAVTQADVDAATITLPGGAVSPHANDVRNWIRAASHVRFKSGARAIDIPIPWKIFNGSSGTIPLPSLTKTDLQTKVVTNPDTTTTTTTYGTNQPIEFDQSYNVNLQAGGVLTTDLAGTTAGGAGQVLTAYLYTVVYRPNYVAWLFNGKYQSLDNLKPNYTTDSALDLKYIVYDALTTGLAAGQGASNGAWGKGFGTFVAGDTIRVPQYNDQDGSPLKNADGSLAPSLIVPAASYTIPAVTRAQATKQAAITTWINHQADVLWAFRCLDTAVEAGNGSASSIDNNSSTAFNAADATTTHVDGADSGWVLLNNTTAKPAASTYGMNRIANLFANGQTPLTYAMARTLIQYGDPNSVFNAAVGADVSQCVKHYLMLFTDGLDNNGVSGQSNPTNSPYFTFSGTGTPLTLSAKAGNDAIIASPTTIDRSGSYWNLFTFAGIGAHMADPSLGTLGTDFLNAKDPGSSTTPGTPSTFLPYSIYKRNGVIFNAMQRMIVMTVGVSLGGRVTDAASPKRSLYLAALAGDPDRKSGTLATDFHVFNGWLPTATRPNDPAVNDWQADPANPPYPQNGKVNPQAVFFFDATNPDKLKDSMDIAFLIAINAGGNNATASPNLPFTGATLGKQVYLGNFQPPQGGGVIWPGDLLMFGTRETSGAVSIVDRFGNLTTTLDSTTAQWSASDALLHARPWNSRVLYTRWPNVGSDTTEHALKPFTYTGIDYDDGAGGGLVNYVATTQDAAHKAAAVQFAMGGDTSTVSAPTPPAATAVRLNVMGDIISSTPAALEYQWSEVQPKLTSRLSTLSGGNRFRLILVGSNQGWLHAFGEVTTTATVQDATGTNQSVVQGAVDELWSFMPTDFLSNLNYITDPKNKHRLMVDGTPSIYHLDLPPSGGGSANGVVDLSERAIAVIGLGKGGRSYYAIDIHDPFHPALKWSLVPDEADNFPASRAGLTGGPDLATVKSVLKNWGYSTATPAYGRILFNGVVRDAVFLSGGFSVPYVDTAFASTLGRSVMALDINTGEVLRAANLLDASISASPTVGPVGAGVIPFEFVINSGMAQRAYFMDYNGGLWCWGSKDVSSATGFKDFRIDTSEITNWSVRKVFQDDNNAKSGVGGRYTATPAPLRIGAFPGPVAAGSNAPATVAIAMISGDRNNPLDRYKLGLDPTGEVGAIPDHHQLTVVFDRQDSRALGLDTASGPDTGIVPGIGSADLLVALPTAQVKDGDAQGCGTPFGVFDPTCSNYFLGTVASPKFGYYRSLPPIITNQFIPKGITPPLVVANSLFYSYFTPQKYDYCSGGQGDTTSWVIGDIMKPIVDDGRTTLSFRSGLMFTWTGVASSYIAIGTRTVLQGGTVTLPGTSLTTPHIQPFRTSASETHPKLRVWRTVQ